MDRGLVHLCDFAYWSYRRPQVAGPKVSLNNLLERVSWELGLDFAYLLMSGPVQLILSPRRNKLENPKAASHP